MLSRDASVRQAWRPSGVQTGKKARRGKSSGPLEMDRADFRGLLEEVRKSLAAGSTIALLGRTGVCDQLIIELGEHRQLSGIEAVYCDAQEDPGAADGIRFLPLSRLSQSKADVLVVAHDVRKEELLWAALPHISGCPKVVIAGHAHFAFRDTMFAHEVAALPVPSLANGYPNSLVHIYECLKNAVRLKLDGIVVELGMFRGGTTMFLSRIIERLGVSWKIIGFDTFEGSPARISALDMYDHEDLRVNDLAAVREYLKGRNVEIIPGNIVETCKRLRDERLVLSFFDTDNYSPATAALSIIRERTVVGGAIVFDHFTGVDRFKYALGERMAAKVLLEDPRYFNLHGTGVFLRQC